MKYLGIVLLVLSSCVMAGEVYYCSDNHNGATGFKKIDGQYKHGLFKENKFKMKLQDDGNIVIANFFDGIDVSFFCGVPFEGRKPKYRNSKSCMDIKSSGNFFNFNADNGRYVLLESAAYVFNNNDTVITSIGTCTKF